MLTGSFILQVVIEHLLYKRSMLVLPELEKEDLAADHNVLESMGSYHVRKRVIYTHRPKAQMKRQDEIRDRWLQMRALKYKCPEARQCHWTLGTLDSLDRRAFPLAAWWAKGSCESHEQGSDTWIDGGPHSSKSKPAVGNCP